MNSLNTCPNTWGLLFHCDSSPHCKITINLKTNYPRSLRWFCLLDLFRTLTKEELHVIFKRHMKVGLQRLSGCCCITEDIHFSIKALKWPPVVQSDGSAPVREDTVTAKHEVPKGDSYQRSGSLFFFFLILGSCVYKTHIQNSEQTFFQPVYTLPWEGTGEWTVLCCGW